MYLPPRVINYTTSKPARSRALLVQSMEPTALFFVCVCGRVPPTKQNPPTLPLSVPVLDSRPFTTRRSSSSSVLGIRARRSEDGPGGTDGRGGATHTLTTTTTTMIAQHVSAKASYAAVSGLNKSRGARAVRARRPIARSIRFPGVDG